MLDHLRMWRLFNVSGFFLAGLGFLMLMVVPWVSRLCPLGHRKSRSWGFQICGSLVLGLQILGAQISDDGPYAFIGIIVASGIYIYI